MPSDRRRRSHRRRRFCVSGEAAARHFFSAIEPAPDGVVSGYWPIDAEFDVRPLLGALHARGHPCGLPVVVGRGRPLVFRSWRPGDRLEAAAFGVSVPLGDAPEVTPGLLLVPLLAFDDRGFRLGYGGGYYDMTLGALGAGGGAVTAVGVGFEAQRVDRVPAGATDRRLDWVVTEARARRIA